MSIRVGDIEILTCDDHRIGSNGSLKTYKKIYCRNAIGSEKSRLKTEKQKELVKSVTSLLWSETIYDLYEICSKNYGITYDIEKAKHNITQYKRRSICKFINSSPENCDIVEKIIDHLTKK